MALATLGVFLPAILMMGLLPAATPCQAQVKAIDQHISSTWVLNALKNYVDAPKITNNEQWSNGFWRTDTASPPRTSSLLMSQGRDTYVMATASKWLGNSQYNYIGAATKGCDFLLNDCWDSTYGGYYWGFNYNGTIPTDDYWNPYHDKSAIGHAAVMLAMASTYQQTGNIKYWNAAVQAWNVIDTNLRSSTNPSGILDSKVRDFSSVGGDPYVNKTRPIPPNLNGIMHTFESLLTMYMDAPAADKQTFYNKTLDLGNFMTQQLFANQAGYTDRGYIADKWNDSNWTPLSIADGGYVNFGHNIETGFLLSRRWKRACRQPG